MDALEALQEAEYWLKKASNDKKITVELHDQHVKLSQACSLIAIAKILLSKGNK